MKEYYMFHKPRGCITARRDARHATVMDYFPEEKLLLAGDTLFAGSVGRTDLPGGDMAVLMRSLKKLTALPDDALVVPGHGPHTSIGAEKMSNPFLLQQV